MSSKNKKVLLAEHEKNITEILMYLLRAWDYDVVTAPDGFSVIETVRREQPDIIIIDFNLPRMDGLMLSKALKEDFLTAHIPVIILIDKKQIRKKMLEIEQGVDDYIANPPDPIDLEVRMEMALRRTMHQLHANALTRLPGNRQIEKVIQGRIEGGAIFSVAYYDIDNFKSFNDKYSYMKGDSIIRQTAYIISTIVKRFGNKDDFVGHIGGDDFVVVTTPRCDKVIASESIFTFDRLVPFHYSVEDRERGFVVSKDRRGIATDMPLMSISVAIANNNEYELQNIVELMEIIAEIKRYLKTLKGSNFLINRRRPAGRAALGAEHHDTSNKTAKQEVGFRYRPLGQILLEDRVLTSQQLEIALNKHWSTGQKIGQCIIDLGMASAGDIVRALETQFNAPHYDIRRLNDNGQFNEAVDKVPLDLMKDLSAIPIREEKENISLIMLNPKDIEAINKVRKITGCNISPFFVLDNEFHELWKRVIKQREEL